MKWYEEKMQPDYGRNNEEYGEYLTPPEAMEMLNIGRNTFYKLVNSGELPALRIGKQWRIRKSDLKHSCPHSWN